MKLLATAETCLKIHKVRISLAWQQLVILFLDQYPILYRVVHLYTRELFQLLADQAVNLLELQRYLRDIQHKETLHTLHKLDALLESLLKKHHKQLSDQFHLLSQLLLYVVIYPHQDHQNKKLANMQFFPTYHLKYHQVPLPFQL